MIVMLVSKKEKLLAMCQNSLLPGQLKERLASLIEERARILEGETAILKITHSYNESSFDTMTASKEDLRYGKNNI